MKAKDYQKLIESTGDGFALFERGELTYMSPSYSRLLGYREEGLSLPEILSRLHPEDMPKIQAEIERGRAEKLATQQYTYRARHREGHFVWLQDVIHREFDENGQEIRTMINARDVTELMETQARLRRALREKEEMFSELTHRVKNNLAMLVSMLDLQAMRVENPEFQKILGDNRDRVNAILQLYTLLFSRRDYEFVDLGTFMRELVAHQKGFLGDEGENNQFWTDIRVPSLRLGLGDAITLGIIVQELITNSLKYAFSPPVKYPERRIATTISWDTEKKQLELVYRDNGRGLPPNVIEERDYGFGLGFIAGLLERKNSRLELSNGTPGMQARILFAPGKEVPGDDQATREANMENPTDPRAD